jgi:hypothetical protein
MIWLMRASNENVAAVVAYPPLVMRLLAPNDPQAFEEAHNVFEQAAISSFKKLIGQKTRPAAEVALPVAIERPSYLELGNAAFGVHYLVTDGVIEGGLPLTFFHDFSKDVKEIDVGYGPVCLYTAQLVERSESVLRTLSNETLRSRYSAAKMNELRVFPESWDSPDREIADPLEWLMTAVETLRPFLAEAVKNKEGLLMYALPDTEDE